MHTTRRGMGLAGFLAVLMLGGTAAAHGVWVAERAGDLTVIYGHGASDEAYDPAKLTSVEGRDAAGKSLPVTSHALETHVRLEVPEEAVRLVFTFDNGFWSQRADGSWVNQPKSAVPDAQRAGQYLKFGTTILAPLATAGEPVGLDFEIVPMVDPLGLAMGDTLPVLVLHAGEPVADALVIAEYTTDSENRSITTDADGMAEITVRNQGLNVIAASHNVATPDNPDADQIGLHATLSFTLGYSGS